MRSCFPLFHSHLDLAHHYWSMLPLAGETVIDATCGNGHDTLKLSQLTLTADRGKVYCFDRQEQAIESARRYIAQQLSNQLSNKVEFHQRCHATFPDFIAKGTIQLIVYNLGYLPGGDKQKTTEANTTLSSLHEAQKLLKEGGVISITCYPGHPAGAKEEEAVLSFAASLPPKEWSCCHHRWLNRLHSPSLLLIQKTIQNQPQFYSRG